MRRILLVAVVATASAAHAAPLSCRKSLLHPTRCVSAPVAAPAASSEPAAPPSARESAETSLMPPPPRVAPAPNAPQTASTTAPPPVAAVADPRSFEPYACNLAEQITLGPSTCSARQIAQSHRIVGGLVHAGRCDEAVRAAHATGDEAYAGRVHDICAARAR